MENDLSHCSNSCSALAIDRAFVVAPVLLRYPLAARVEVVPVWDSGRIVASALYASRVK